MKKQDQKTGAKTASGRNNDKNTGYTADIGQNVAHYNEEKKEAEKKKKNKAGK